ncbi:HNH endonuclease signature motif containing protein [Pseudarthrobacter sp. efr-133-R2A-89]|uniref:HNH endonuclease signature motif containing protein n=1 Tax=Pseudarthrobacter sp. efr-133-R2A-89 TaxID=3040302 RepID=UPI002552E459|nr:HNH endonuclease signature motif containing protein [Pseudarthrobacter sp. efr-133-R2A-89]
MGIGSDLAVVMEGVSASVAALSGLVLADGYLTSDLHAGADVDVLQRRYGLYLERLELVARLEAQLAAVKAQDVADAIDIQHALLPPDAPVEERTYAEMSAVEEIAGILTISSPAAGALVEQSRRVCSLPPVFETLSAGGVSWQHARIVADETEGLTPDSAAGLVAHFFDPDAPHPARGAAPGELVPSRFRAKVRAWRERHHPESLEKRHVKGVADRRMDYAPDRDGMAWLSLYLPGDTACAIWNRSTATARRLQRPDEPRTLTQLRADVAASLLLGAGLQPTTSSAAADADTEPAAAAEGAGNDAGPGCASTDIGKVPAPRADVLVTVPVFSLLGLTEEPALLDGFGPIPASMARRLVAGGAETFYRVLVDPRDGAPLEIGRTRYRLPETIKQWIRLRDRTCTFPGCTNHTPDNDTDHLTPWHHGGTTDARNLAQLCPRHHRLKHARPWTPDPATRNEPPGWTSPTGRHYQPEHPDPQPTHWPPGTLPARIHAMPVQFQGEPAGIEDIPPWEPDDANLIDLNDLSPEDPLWAEFFETPFALSE